MSTRDSSVANTLEYRFLIFAAGWLPTSRAVDLWTTWWISRTPKMRGDSRIRLHGRRITVNTGFAYPAFMRRWPRYNSPLVALVTAVRDATNRTLTVMDVGAAVGDTVLLLAERAGGHADTYICVEPDDEFRRHLVRNLAHLEVTVSSSMLSAEDELVPSPIRTHSGSASPQGESAVQATTVDAIVAEDHVDVIKIDTDGWDGKVLAGALATLRRYQPAVIFEWHPLLLQACGQDFRLPFEVLAQSGYGTFVWFTKHGDLSHVDSPHDAQRTDALAAMCLDGNGPEPDWHYDVVAVPNHLSDIVPSLTSPASRR